jgi:hypothetical protein
MIHDLRQNLSTQLLGNIIVELGGIIRLQSGEFCHFIHREKMLIKQRVWIVSWRKAMVVADY